MLAIALPSGRLMEECVKLLENSGISFPKEILESRRLSGIIDNKKFLICKPKDVPIYVEYGTADIGMVGKDILLEENTQVYELYDLGIGRCRIVVAIPNSLEPEEIFFRGDIIRVATKYPRIARDFFNKRGISIEILNLSGSIELAPVTGIADVIVDIVSTGRTLKENNLRIWEEIAYSSARLIANRASLHIKADEIEDLLNKLKRG
ncbi:MAG: ATP phosphoribosyltransferase [Dictyoglomi bacterium]|jgi:ATP phosphoribosyltransferase|nr:ATP phosphoribosyltransferase [Dictyoglomota bacterium]HOL54304.1 ATP phosphoribosyltransferase [bacterium]